MNQTGFDAKSYLEINEARWRYLEPWLERLIRTADLRHALDVGAGAGYFSERLAGVGIAVTAIDGRAENVAEIASRYPLVQTAVVDVQQPNALAPFHDVDLIFCAGLLYHLENPVAAIQNLGRAAARVMLIETQLIPEAGPMLRLVEEGASATQGLEHLALVPSRATLIRLLHLFGWQCVYALPGNPDHWQFQETRRHHQLRSVFIASRAPLTLPGLQLLTSSRAGKGFQEKPRSVAARIAGRLFSR